MLLTGLHISQLGLTNGFIVPKSVFMGATVVFGNASKKPLVGCVS